MDRPFVVMAKPIGSKCNMRCDYCYYLKTDYGADDPVKKMSDEDLECMIKKTIAENPGNIISFTWHGGEPTLAGIEFYKKAVELEKKYLPQGKQCWNNLQTNGTLLDDEWCAFLKENHFDVGISIDGTRRIHENHRPFPDGRTSYEAVAAGIARLKKAGILPDLLCTVTEETAHNGAEVYRTLRNFETGWIQFIPIVVRNSDGNVSSDSVKPDSYGEFLKDVFYEWFYHDLGKVQVQLFAECLEILAGGNPQLCYMTEKCGNALIVEHDGSIYSCDHFVNSDHRIGNIREDDFQKVLASPFQQKFGDSKKDDLTRECRECPYLKFCNGGCLKDRFAKSEDEENGQYYLCEGLKAFFSYSIPKLQELLNLAQRRIPQDQIKAELLSSERKRFRGIGRNDLCPCGSGRKLKNCCINRIP